MSKPSSVKPAVAKSSKQAVKKGWYGLEWGAKIEYTSYEVCTKRHTALGRVATISEPVLILQLRSPIPTPPSQSTDEDILKRLVSPLGRSHSSLLAVFDTEYPGLWTVEDYSIKRDILYCRCAVPKDKNHNEGNNDEMNSVVLAALEENSKILKAVENDRLEEKKERERMKDKHTDSVISEREYGHGNGEGGGPSTSLHDIREEENQEASSSRNLPHSHNRLHNISDTSYSVAQNNHIYSYPSIKYYPRPWGKPCFLRMPTSQPAAR
jgi:hypothetical protein